MNTKIIRLLKESKYWLIANVLLLVLYIFFASVTWSIGYAISGSRSSLVDLIRESIIFFSIVMNTMWLITILIRNRRAKLWSSMLCLIIVVVLWGIAYCYDAYRFRIEAEKSQKELQ